MLQQFVLKLFQNPNFAGQPLSLVENHIKNFVTQNMQNLAPMLAGDAFFPGKPPQEAVALLLTAVGRHVSDQILKKANEIVPSHIDFSICNKLDGGGGLSPEDMKANFMAYLAKIVAHPDARLRIDAANIILSQKLIDNYVNAAFNEKKFIYNELSRVEKHRFNAEDGTEYLKFCTLIVPGFFIKLNDTESGLVGVNAHDLKNQKARQDAYFNKSKEILSSMIKGVHDDFWDTARGSLFDLNSDPEQDAGARLLAIMFARARDYRAGQKVEKGAETPDKSWFSIQIRNASFTGLDKEMLENLNRLAFELGY